MKITAFQQAAADFLLQSGMPIVAIGGGIERFADDAGVQQGVSLRSVWS
jgi:hypothetical protein